MNKEIDISGVSLKTERLVLREWKKEDLDDFYEYAGVEGVGEMAGWPHHESIDVTAVILDSFIKGKKTFALEYNSKVIGSLGIEKYNEEDFPELNDKQGRELGFVLSKDYWGKGLMPEAVKEVSRYLFEEEGLDFLLCGHFPENEQSRKVQEKCGFREYRKLETTLRSGLRKDMCMRILERSDKAECSK